MDSGLPARVAPGSAGVAAARPTTAGAAVRSPHGASRGEQGAGLAPRPGAVGSIPQPQAPSAEASQAQAQTGMAGATKVRANSTGPKRVRIAKAMNWRIPRTCSRLEEKDMSIFKIVNKDGLRPGTGPEFL